jgi:ankyrin repeat protein
MVSHLINEKSMMYQDKKTGSSPLMVAVQHRQFECVKQLLGHEACTPHVIQLVSYVTLRTVFHICAEVNQDDITKELCQTKYLSTLLVLAADLQGDTPLHICAKVGNACMTKILIDYIKRNSSSFTTTEVTPHTTTHRSMTNLDTNGRVTSKPSPTITQITTQQSPVMGNVKSMLIKKNKNKYTPLHVAIYFGNYNVIEEMIPSLTLSVINEYDDQKRTSLHMAAEKGQHFSQLNKYGNIGFKSEYYVHFKK